MTYDQGSNTIDLLAKANSVRWYGHALRKDKSNFLKRAPHFVVKGNVHYKLQYVSIFSMTYYVSLDIVNCCHVYLNISVI